MARALRLQAAVYDPGPETRAKSSIPKMTALPPCCCTLSCTYCSYSVAGKLRSVNSLKIARTAPASISRLQSKNKEIRHAWRLPFDRQLFQIISVLPTSKKQRPVAHVIDSLEQFDTFCVLRPRLRGREWNVCGQGFGTGTRRTSNMMNLETHCRRVTKNGITFGIISFGTPAICASGLILVVWTLGLPKTLPAR